MNKNILLLYKFRHERSEKFIENVLVPNLSENFVIRKVSSASNDAKNKDYWVKIVHDLTYASDIVLTIRSKVNNNIIVENDFLTRILYSKLPYDDYAINVLGYNKYWLVQLCRPIQIDITLTDRWIRKNKYKIKGKENSWRLEFNITQDKDFIEREIVKSISEGIKYKQKIWLEDYEINKEQSKELKHYFTDLKLVILDNKLIRKSSYLFSKTIIRHIINQDIKYQYKRIAKELKDIYILVKLIPDFMQSIKDLKYFNTKFRKKINKKFRKAIGNCFESESERFVKFLKFYIPFLLLLTIPMIIISIPINIIYSGLKKI